MTIELIVGDCRDVLQAWPAESVDCIVTSPPYFGLRDYNMTGQMGLEKTPADFVESLVTVLRECRRVLRDDGTLWLNLGDSYSVGGNGGGAIGSKQSTNVGAALPPKKTAGYAPKQLLGIPWRVALALQADGWFLRQDIVWSKPNPMPESVLDRCTKAHEYIFLLSKSESYYFDYAAIEEPAVWTNSGRKSATGDQLSPTRKRTGEGGLQKSFRAIRDTRRKRSVWTIPIKGFKGAHFATFPPELAEPCILAGCRPGGTVLDPFGGAGTTAMVARQRGRNAVLIELNPEYAQLAADRLNA